MGLRRPLLLRHSLSWRLGLLVAAATVSLAVPAIANAAPPDGVTGLALDGRVELAWQPAAGAGSYRVYRGTTPTTVTTQIATGVITTFTTDAAATNGTTFYYSVRAVIGGVESPDSRLVEATPRARSCSTGNPIVVENCFPGSSGWNLTNPGTVNGIEGFATAQSIAKGESVRLKVNTGAASFRIEIYRSGYYGDSGARLISTIRGVTGGLEPACTTDSQTGLIDCSNWSTSATLTTTSAWATGAYLLRLVRDDNGGDSHILLVVRDDARNSDVLYGVGFTDYQAYNGWGGKSLYDFNSNGLNTVAGTSRAVKVSYDRPFKQATIAEPNWFTKIEHQTISWLEQSGYDVTYQSDADLERNGARVRNHHVYILPSHDEYYSAAMRTALEGARDAGVNLFSTGANQVYWKIRFENGAGGQDRIQVCYKSTQSGGADPSGIPTGTWRDPAGANRPENQLLGAMYVGDNNQQSFPLRVSAAEGADRLYRYTGLDAQPAGTTTAIGTDILGWEWDVRFANGFEPAGVRTLASSPVNGQLLMDAGRVQAPGSTTAQMVRYRAASGALVVNASTNQWNRGLARTLTGEGTPDLRIQQTTTNVLADMGAVPATPAAGITADDPSGATIAAPTGVAAVAVGTDSIRISWNAVAGATGYRIYRNAAARNAGVPVGTLASGTPVTGTSFSDFGLNAGAAYFYIVTAVKGAVQSPFSSEVSATTDGFAGGTTVRINSGGGAYTSALGRVYSADTSFTGGAGFVTINPVSGTTDPALYQSERWGQFSYSIPVSNGTYDVRFHFVELYYGTEIPGSCIGKRIFGMDVLDTTGIDIPPTMDVCAEVGVRTALVKIVRGVQITDGAVDIRSVYGAADDPEVAAIEVVSATPPAPDTTPPSVSLTAPAAGATVSGTTTVTANASDDVGVAGVQFKLDGANLGTEDTAAPFSTSWDTLAAANGTHTLTAVARDAAGNTTTSAVTSVTVQNATAPPTVTITSGPSGTTTSAAASFSFSSEAGATFQCALDAAAFTACSSPKSYTGLADGSHTFQVRGTNTVGTGPAASRSWTIDTTPPAVTITAGPSGTTNSAATSFSFSSEAGASFQCALDGAAFTACTSPQAYTGLADSSHTFQVKATDQAGNTGAAASRSWTIDTTPPSVTITTGPTGATASASASFAFSSEAGASFQCALDGAALTSCTSPQAYSALADGSHTFQVKATDQAGNTGAPATRTWTVDTTPPDVTITAGPSGTTTSAAASFSFSSEAGAGFQCALDGAPFSACTSPQAYSALADGQHTVQVRATDAAGNTGTATSRSWTIDTIPPTVTITAGPSGTTTAAGASFSFSSEAGAGFQCALDGAPFTGCTSPQAYSTLADGQHTFQVKATDAAGNTSTPTSRSWTIDTTPPSVTITAGPSGTTNSAGASFSFSSEAGAGFQCALDGALFTGCTSPQAYSALADGSHTFQVKATDAAGNTSTPTSRSWTIDTTPPSVTITAGPSGTTTSAGASFSFSSEAGAGFQCALDSSAFSACSSPQAYSTLADGQHTFQVTATDQAGNTSTVTSRTWTIDTTPPSVTITAGPSGTTTSAAASFSFSTEAGATFQCALDSAAFSTCSSPQAYSPLADGQHTFQVKATDEAGNTSSALSRSWTIDTIAPTTTISQSPSNPSSSTSPSFSFTGSEAGASFQCALDGAAFTNCASPKSYTALADGSHTFQVKATDAAGNTGAAAAHTWAIDTTPPSVTISAGPSGTATSGGASFSFDSEAGASFQCALDGASFTSCTSPQSYAGLADGQHTFQVKATDQAGNTSSAVTRSWTIDTTPPSVTITSGPGGATTSGNVSFSFTSETGANFECALDTAPFGACSSPQPYSALADGQHTFQVKATDQAGNPSAPTSRSWTVDTIAPTATISQSPTNPSSSTSPSFSFTSNEAGAGFECALDSGTFGACASPQSYTAVADGSHTFQVKATDQAGNTGAAASYTWTIDTTPPAVTITTGPSGTTSSAAASLSFSAEAGASFQCALDTAAFTSCTSPQAYSALADGSHTFQVKASDQAGNTSTPATRTWTIDTSAPSVTITAGPTGATTSASASFSFSSEAGASFQCALDTAAFSACTSPQAYSALADGSHTFQVKASDQAGNTGTPASRTWTIDTAAPAVSVTAPAAGTTVSATTTVTASASDNVGVAGVQFKLDGANLGTEDTAAPYSVPWDTTTATNAAHTLTAVVRDTAGNTATSASVSVTVSNAPPDTTPPTASITAPVVDATVSGTITVTASASDNVGVAGVQFKLDGANLGAEDTAAPYSVSWNTVNATVGPHNLTAVARDAAGNRTTSTTVGVTSVSRINTGGSALTTSAGAVWSADARFTGGSTNTTTSTITGTSDQLLYRNERWGQFSYAIPAANGTYDVRFHFVEMYYGTTVSGDCVGKRIFGMDVLDTPTSPDISALDICARVGPNAALVVTVPGVTVSDGTLNVQSVYGSVDDPELAAIEVVPASGPPPPPPPPTVTSKSPADGSTGVATGGAVSAVFSRAMDAATITTTSFTVSPPAGSAVAATVAYNSATQTASLTPSAALADGTTYTARLDATITAADGTALAAPVTWTFTTATPGAPGTTTTRINTGGGAVTTTGGLAFQADALFTGGGTWAASSPITGTTDPALYQNERWGQFSYAIPVTNGLYDVRFHFVELYYGTSVPGSCVGKRIFGMDILDTPGIDIPATQDVCAQVGPNAALVRTVRGVSITDGTLNTQSVYGSVDDPELAAIEVVPAS